MSMRTEPAPRTCRCGAHLARFAASGSRLWVDEHIDWLCTDGKPHTPACPPSRITDMIIPAAEVRVGDLALWDGQLTLVQDWQTQSCTSWEHAGVISLMINGVCECVGASDYVAVRRYTEG